MASLRRFTTRRRPGQSAIRRVAAALSLTLFVSWNASAQEADPARGLTTISSDAVGISPKLGDTRRGSRQSVTDTYDAGVRIPRTSTRQTKPWTLQSTGVTTNGQTAGATCQQPGENCQRNDINSVFTSDRTALFTIADDFVPAVSGDITSLCWRGAYMDFSAATAVGCAAAPQDNFLIRYYADNNGIPGNTIAIFVQIAGTVTIDAKTPTCDRLADIATEISYSSSHGPVPVVAGQRYWVEITNDISPSSCSWVWEAGEGNGLTYQDGMFAAILDGYTANEALPEDAAFCIDLPLTEPARPANDDCVNARPIDAAGLFDFNINLATTDGMVLTPCAAPQGPRIDSDVWYCFTSPCTDKVFVRTCGQTSVDTIVAVYEGCSVCPPGENILLGANDDLCGELGRPKQSMVIFDATAGSQYMIRVGRFPGANRGTGRIDITCGPPATGGCDALAGDCCDVAGTTTPGCSDDACCATVCACDPFCCSDRWDAGCATFGFQGSGCGAALLCQDACAECGNPFAGDCCSDLGTGTPFCSDATCCAAVCACDPFCCEVEWDVGCATSNNDRSCGADIQCADLCREPVCPPGAVAAVDPPNGVVDARRPHPPYNAAFRQGIDTIIFEAPAGSDKLECWTLCETSMDGAANTITAVIRDANTGNVTLTLDRPATAAAVTTITYTDDNGLTTRATFTVHPSNTNANTRARAADVWSLVLFLRGMLVPPWGQFSVDINHSGRFTPIDILGTIDLLNGGGDLRRWNTTALPTGGTTCP